MVIEIGNIFIMSVFGLIVSVLMVVMFLFERPTMFWKRERRESLKKHFDDSVKDMEEKRKTGKALSDLVKDQVEEDEYRELKVVEDELRKSEDELRKSYENIAKSLRGDVIEKYRKYYLITATIMVAVVGFIILLTIFTSVTMNWIAFLVSFFVGFLVVAILIGRVKVGKINLKSRFFDISSEEESTG